MCVPEGLVLSVFRQVLEQRNLEPTENFFTAGGDSAKCVEAASLLQIRPPLLHAFPTARKLTAHMNNSADKAPGVQS